MVTNTTAYLTQISVGSFISCCVKMKTGLEKAAEIKAHINAVLVNNCGDHHGNHQQPKLKISSW